MNYHHLMQTAFVDSSFDPDLKVDAKLWLRELFMQCQMNAEKMKYFGLPMIGMFLGGLPIMVDMMIQKFDIFGDQAQPMTAENYWKYNGACFFINMMLFTVNPMFMNIAIVDASKKNMMMLRMSQVLDFTFHAKDNITVRLPVFNLIDP